MTVFEYLVGCWKRLNSAKTNLIKKVGVTRSVCTKRSYVVPQNPVIESQQASVLLEKIRDLVISYAGLTLQDPEMFPQPSGCVSNCASRIHHHSYAYHRRELGPSEFVGSLLSLSALSTPLTTASSPNHVLSPTEVQPFLQDLARRFEPDNEIDDVLGPVIRRLLFHPSLFRPEGLAGGDSSWRGVVGGVEALVSIKSIAIIFTRLDEWNPPHATAPTFETVTLMGPLCRLGVFSREWVR